MSFEDYKLSPEVVSGLNDVNFIEPTPLQKKVLPVALEGSDLLIEAHTGIDKDGAFLIPVAQKVSSSEKEAGTRALILTPNEERARKLDEQVWAMGYHAQISCAPIEMGGDRKTQVEALRANTPVLVANPGQLIELLTENRAIFNKLDMLVLDEADVLAGMNLLPKVKDIIKRITCKHQTMILAAKMDDELEAFARKVLNEPEVVGFDGLTFEEDKEEKEEPKDQKETSQTAEKGGARNGQQKQKTEEPSSETKSAGQIPKDLEQGYIYVPGRMKISTLMAHLDETPTDNVVIFTASKRGTDRLYRILRKQDKKVTSLHGKLSDEKHDERMQGFKKGNYQFLLVTDCSAADLDLDHVMQVINYDVPGDVGEYLRRTELVGSGKATRIVSLVSKQDRSDIDTIEKELGTAPRELPLPEEVKKKKQQKKSGGKGRNKGRGGRRGGRGRGRGRGNGRSGSGGSRGRRGGRKGKQKRRGNDDLQLPRPSYDKLSGGRSGRKEEKKESKGIIGFVKKLFS